MDGPKKKESIEKVLLTFVGNRDPFHHDKKRGHVEGPTLSLLGLDKSQRPSFTQVELFHDEDMRDCARETAKKIQNSFPIEARTHLLSISSVVEYGQIFEALRPKLKELGVDDPPPDREFFINVAPGTPQMHACWLVMAARGEISATLFHKRDDAHLKEGESRLAYVNPYDLVAPLVDKGAAPSGLSADLDAEIQIAWTEIGIVANDENVMRVYRNAAKAARGDIPILILGESGTGKEFLARFIRELSARKDQKLIAFDCGTLPPHLIQTELFGHEKGAFTGAVTKREGLFQAANGGTLFLDEIGNLPLDAQASLLRALQGGHIRPVGSTREQVVDVRFIAATNANIENLIEAGNFREDLYQRIKGVVLTLPPLRERQDIVLMAEHFLKFFGGKYEKQLKFSDNAHQILQEHGWRGNVRDLRMVVERCVLFAVGETIDDSILREAIG